VALVGVDLLARSARIRALLPTTLRRALLINCCGESLAVVTPFRAGGEPIRFMGFLRSGLRGPTILAAFATETVVDLLILAAGAAVFSMVVAFGGDRGLGRLAAAFLGQRSGTTLALFGALVAAMSLVAWRWPTLASRGVHLAGESWRGFRTQRPAALLAVAALTLVSFAARAAILPVFLSSIPGLSHATVVVGSIAALYAILLTPTPSGLGIVEAAFFAGLHQSMPSGALLSLMLTWRSYSVVLGAALGGLLLLRERGATVAPAAEGGSPPGAR
jgi:uncharacterized membrane protein YbhN (UPF0104 family)